MARDNSSEGASPRYELFFKVLCPSVLRFCAGGDIHMPQCTMCCCTRLAALRLQNVSINCIPGLNTVNKHDVKIKAEIM